MSKWNGFILIEVHHIAFLLVHVIHIAFYKLFVFSHIICIQWKRSENMLFRFWLWHIRSICTLAELDRRKGDSIDLKNGFRPQPLPKMKKENASSLNLTSFVCWNQI